MNISQLNIAQTQPSTQALGPGNRFVIWVQGCPFNCKGCISPKWIPFKMAKPTQVSILAEQIIQNKSISGITLSGGEPFMQSKNLTELLKIVKKERPELNVITFTGFEKEQLIWEEAKTFLKYIDVLIAGVYIEKLNEGKGLRGSTNQKIIFLTDRLLPWKTDFFEKESTIEFHEEKDGVLMVGIPKQNFSWLESYKKH